MGKLQIVDQQENVVFEKEIFDELGIQRQTSHVVTKKEKSSAKKVKQGSQQNEDSSSLQASDINDGPADEQIEANGDATNT